jgi:hypothetical protein
MRPPAIRPRTIPPRHDRSMVTPNPNVPDRVGTTQFIHQSPTLAIALVVRRGRLIEQKGFRIRRKRTGVSHTLSLEPAVHRTSSTP